MRGLILCFQKLDRNMSRSVINEQQIILVAIDQSLIIFTPQIDMCEFTNFGVSGRSRTIRGFEEFCLRTCNTIGLRGMRIDIKAIDKT